MFFSKIALKIIFVITLSVLIIQLTMVDTIESRIYESELSKVVDQQARFTEANAIHMAELMNEGQEDNIYLVLSTIAANPLIVGARLDFSDKRDFLQVGEQATSLIYSFDITDIDDDDNWITVGTLSTYATTAYIDATRSERTQSILRFMLTLLLVVFVVTAFAVQYFVGVPIKQITKAISTDDRIPIIYWRSRDEMGVVVKRLNYLHKTLGGQLTGLERELSENERREAARMQSLVNASLEGLLLFKDNTIIDLNEPMVNLMGSNKGDLIHASVSSVLNLEHHEVIRQSKTNTVALEEFLKSNDKMTAIATTLTHPNGDQLPVEIYFKALEDHPKADTVAVVRDISERRQAEKAMWRMAHFDSLTDLPNRRYFIEIFEKAMSKARLDNRSLTVAYLDLDNFKFINDSRGHAAGDQLLCAVAKSIRDTVGDENLCARLGGDEFAILFENSESAEPADLKLKKVFTNIIDGDHCKAWRNLFSVSIGAATLEGAALDKNELLTCADLALYKAKESGRGRICFYSDHLDAELKRSRLIVEKLVTALEQDKLELYYQPQVLCDGSEIIGFEALLRWTDPDLGQVSPVEIVETAEREGIVQQLSRWVMTEAFKEAMTWPDHIRLAVNLSPMELVDDKLPQFVTDALSNTGLTPGRLEIEITETALVSDFGKAAKLLSSLKEMGIMIALDDFGTGYSSLSMLQEFPFDRIKIDRSFVSNLSDDKNKASIVASILDLGSRLELDVIAEGVESESDVETLRRFNCQECQGYFISKPVPPEKLPEIIARYPSRGRGDTDYRSWKLAS